MDISDKRDERPYQDLRIPDPTDCSPQRPGSLTLDERALLVLGDESRVDEGRARD